MTYDEQHSLYLVRCEEALSKVVRQLFVPCSTVSQAAEYSLVNGGKRVRGVLVLAVCDLLDNESVLADDFAAAIEMIHSFSLIHDDLPCMDDDDMRRGKPANHIVYGEATAMLAGDMLAIAPFEVIARANLSAEARIEAVRILASGAGGQGMIFGQELDLKYENQTIDEATLLEIHRNKTGALIRAAAHLGVCAAGKKIGDCAEITNYANNIGLAFQIVDDILDETATAETLGKPIGSDKEQGKTTFVTMYGPEKSRQEVERLTQKAMAGLKQMYGDESWFLCEFAQKLANRIY